MPAPADRQLTAGSRVLVAGGGIAAAEVLLALRELAPAGALAPTLLAPDRELRLRALTVLDAVELGHAPTVPLEDLAAETGADLRRGELAAVDPVRRVATTEAGAELPYDALVVALGAHPVDAVPGATVFRGEHDGEAVAAVLTDLEQGGAHRLAVIQPGGPVWPLPAVEIALLAAARLRARDVEGAEVALVTPETAPLEVFGPAPQAAVAEMLAAAGVATRTGARAVSFDGETLRLRPGPDLPCDRAIALAGLRGPAVPGLPYDDEGFLPVDLHGRLRGAADVYAAGDCTTFPLKHGGLAAQQADAVAEAIAARAGAPGSPTPFRPVLRGMLVTGPTAHAMVAEVSGGRGDPAPPATVGLWRPGKVSAGRLTPWLAGRVELRSPPAPHGATPVDVAF